MNIYVGNLPYDVSEQELQETFEDYGAVNNVSIIRDKMSGRSKGFAFVEMGQNSEAQAAIESLNGREMSGRVLTVNEARPREERPAGENRMGNRGRNSGTGGESRDRNW